MKLIRFTVVLATILFATQVQAEPGHGDDGVSTRPKPTPKLKLTHKIEASKVKVDIDIEDSLQWKGLLQAYPAKQFFDRIQGLPGIENIQFTPGKHSVQPEGYDKEVVISKRKSSLMVRVQGSSPFSLLFSVEESLKRCKTTAMAQGNVHESKRPHCSLWDNSWELCQSRSVNESNYIFVDAFNRLF